MTNWVGKDGEIGIPAESLFIGIFTLAGYALICGAIHVLLRGFNPEGKKPTVEDSLLQKLFKTPQFFYRAIFLVMACVVGYLQIQDTCDEGRHCDNWHLIYWYSLLFVVTANVSNRPYEFYLGEGVSMTDLLKFYLRSHPLPTAEDLEQRVRDKYLSQSTNEEADAGIGFWTLMPSAFITWIFAKSIRNSAVLGARFGVLGGLAYDSWYLSFFSSAIVCYVLRTRYNFKSLPTAIFKNYGAVAVICFQLCVLFRLFNEVWSNSSVIGTFYGSTGSDKYWGATWFSVAIPAGYVLMGGMRVSLFSDVFQAGLAVTFLAVILGFIASDEDFSKQTNAFEYSPSESIYGVDGWQPGWWAYTIAGALGGSVSYPWFDPVLTDRAFLGRPKTMLKSFFVGGFLAMLFIFFYAVIGIYGVWLEEKYAADCGCSGGAALAATSACPTDWSPCEFLAGERGEASDVAAILGQRTYRGVEVFVNLVMITASLSTLDSTFTSAAKLVSLEFCGWLQLEGDTREAMGPLRPVDIDHIGHQHITVARAFIVILMFVGNSFLGMETDAMKATTVAGMAVMGLGFPIWWMTIWRTKREGRRGWRRAPLAFVAPFAVGWFFGLSYYFQGKDVADWKALNPGLAFPESELGWTYDLNIAGSYTKNSGEEADYAYGRYLGTMLLGHAICLGAFVVFFVLHQVLPLTLEVEAESEGEDTALRAEVEDKEIETSI
ncbi:unnamed protein product [Prorocentrum cordatum]|uniref:Uncharacterized protein n=1 Tax=Prorocentrum cordatum TaxID=2364126 RepID=A0ABN9YI30_9DINO|nr:unnamed protein product [Polarella glacialis]|mmetsp:Transcript_56403/g.160666  ORF Transcript_56403/g.160666 Transcript_56403/m.160666 type:complete len:716 (-) Transcript_56403:373-2520(-)